MPNDLIRQTLRRAKKDKVTFIDLQFTDFLGNIKVVTTPVARLERAVRKGIWFDGSSVEGFARIHESDMYLLADPSTYALIPFRNDGTGSNVARLICDVYTPAHKPFEGDPRYILKKVTNEAKKMGYIYKVGPELEFFLFPKDKEDKIVPVSRGNGYYFSLILDESYQIKKEIVEALKVMGIASESITHEVADNQHEIDLVYGDALTIADNTITLKLVIKAIARRHGLHASFMPKPIFGVSGNGMHTHQSLWKTNKNAFYNAGDKYHLSKTAYQFLAGQLKYVKEIAAIIAPTVSSYKRLTPGFEAPAYICWAKRNRSALVRIPESSKGDEETSARIELRCPDPSCNPYLAFAVMLESGLKGIKKEMKPPNPIEEDVYEFDDSKLSRFYIEKLPGSLKEALDFMEKGNLVKEVFGDYAFRRYLETKKLEWDSFRTWVTDWELNRYLPNV